MIIYFFFKYKKKSAPLCVIFTWNVPRSNRLTLFVTRVVVDVELGTTRNSERNAKKKKKNERDKTFQQQQRRLVNQRSYNFLYDDETKISITQKERRGDD